MLSQYTIHGFNAKKHMPHPLLKALNLRSSFDCDGSQGYYRIYGFLRTGKHALNKKPERHVNFQASSVCHNCRSDGRRPHLLWPFDHGCCLPRWWAEHRAKTCAFVGYKNYKSMEIIIQKIQKLMFFFISISCYKTSAKTECNTCKNCC